MKKNQITFNYEGTKYTLEITRRTAGEIEAMGFKSTEIADKPNLMIPILWEGAFLAHHRDIKKDIIDEIYKKISNKNEFITSLITLYAATIETLMEEPKEDKGNVSWKMS